MPDRSDIFVATTSPIKHGWEIPRLAMEVQFAGKIIEPLWGGFSSGAGTSISTQGPARVASEGVSMDC